MVSDYRELDVVVVGAGFGGLYSLYKLRESGYSVQGFEAASDVGGVWYWNRYPGARVDSESIYYAYTFSEKLYKGWDWTEKYADSHELRKYFDYVAKELDLRKSFKFNTRVTRAHFDDELNKWRIETDQGDKVLAKFFIAATGFLSAPNIPEFPGIDNFKGEIYHTSHWPHEEVNLEGKRVGVIGSGSSGIQVITEASKVAKHLISFQRTPQYSVPLRNRPIDKAYMDKAKEEYEEIRQAVFTTNVGRRAKVATESAVEDKDFEKNFEKVWDEGGFNVFYHYKDIMTDIEANNKVSEFARNKIQQIVNDQDVAEKLKPNYPFGGKRLVFDSGYYETYNKDNVSFVHLKETPIETFTEKGIRTTDKEYELDIIILATGYDAMTGALTRMDIRGRNGITLQEKWDDGHDFKTYLGITLEKFPNMFMVAGPQSPATFVNGPSLSEFTGDWIYDCIRFVTENNIETIEPKPEEEVRWTEHLEALASQSIFSKVDSWYNAGNIDGKPRNFLTYLGGFIEYQRRCHEGAENDYQGFLKTYNKSKQNQMS